MVKQTRRFKTYSDYKGAVENHIKPHIEKIKLDRLSQGHIYGMLDALSEAKAGPATLDKVYRTLHAALEVAFKRQKIAANVVGLLDRPKHSNAGKIILRTPQEIKSFIDAANNSRFGALYLAALDTGARSGELRALKWQDVDLANGLIHINATLTENEDGKIVSTKPKTESSVRSSKRANGIQTRFISLGLPEP